MRWAWTDKVEKQKSVTKSGGFARAFIGPLRNILTKYDDFLNTKVLCLQSTDWSHADPALVTEGPCYRGACVLILWAPFLEIIMVPPSVWESGLRVKEGSVRPRPEHLGCGRCCWGPLIWDSDTAFGIHGPRAVGHVRGAVTRPGPQTARDGVQAQGEFCWSELCFQHRPRPPDSMPTWRRSVHAVAGICVQGKGPSCLTWGLRSTCERGVCPGIPEATVYRRALCLGNNHGASLLVGLPW